MSERTIRCAVYTRKSSEEGLEQAFNSLEAQREAGLDYIKSQKHQGWVAVPSRYDDGGYSGGSTDRPGLQKLLADIQSRRVDVVVVYKVDRLSRSLADFARLMQVFDEQQVSFVSVTQQFNTTTSMGRLTLNMLLSFAQFEREVAGERIRDKIAATKKKGIWIGGIPPIGYRLPREDDEGHVPGDRTLRVVEHEASIVREIFRFYAETGSLVKLAQRMREAGHTTKRWRSGAGKPHGGRPLCTTDLYRILTNPIYLGKITHTRGSTTAVYDAAHEPIVPRPLWDEVHARMERIERETRHRWTHTHLLKGKIRTFEGATMSPGSVHKMQSLGRAKDGTRLVRYYVSQKAIKQGYANCPIKSVNAGHLDDLTRALVCGHVRQASGADLMALPAEERDQRIRDTIHVVTLAPDRLSIELDRDRLECIHKHLAASTRDGHSLPKSRGGKQRDGGRVTLATDVTIPTCPFKPDIDDSGPRIILTVRAIMKRLDGRRVLVAPSGDDLLLSMKPDGTPVAKQHIVRAIGQAFVWRRELLATGASISAMSKRHGVTDGWVHELITLTQLGPAILRDALAGNLRSGIRLDDLIAAARHLDWSVQSKILHER
ncbi:MAG: recombinase family protein [Phycisphaerales bacterium]|nr:recombinase family protein [Phycisphaerales bacterium]